MKNNFDLIFENYSMETLGLDFGEPNVKCYKQMTV